MTPIIDSVVAGVDTLGRAGLWVYLRPNPADSLQDLAGLDLYRATLLDTTADFHVVWIAIPPNVGRVFDTVSFDLGRSSRNLVYRAIAKDSANLPQVSDVPVLCTTVVCNAAEIISPAIGDTVNQQPVFRWSVKGLARGYKMFIHVGKVDTILWKQQVCPQEFGCGDIMEDGYTAHEYSINFNQDGSALLQALTSGRYWWCMRIIHGAKAQAGSGGIFEVNTGL